MEFKHAKPNSLTNLDLFMSALDACNINYSIYELSNGHHYCHVDSEQDDSYLVFEFDMDKKFVKVK